MFSKRGKKCERCDKIAPKGDRYCGKCNSDVLKEMQGYLGDPRPPKVFSDERGRRRQISPTVGAELPETDE